MPRRAAVAILDGKAASDGEMCAHEEEDHPNFFIHTSLISGARSRMIERPLKAMLGHTPYRRLERTKASDRSLGWRLLFRKERSRIARVVDSVGVKARTFIPASTGTFCIA